MFALAVAAATVSLLGSPHCAGMCGPFVLLAADTRRPGFSAVVYHLGRLSTYLLLGLAAGLAGLAVDAGARAVAIQQAAATLAGVTMVGFGVVALVRRFIPSLPGGHTAPPAFVQRWVQ
ncbi:MAG: sulfite exporter TauE/SafE family protein, partial [Planctomycetota bacterium]